MGWKQYLGHRKDWPPLLADWAFARGAQFSTENGRGKTSCPLFLDSSQRVRKELCHRWDLSRLDAIVELRWCVCVCLPARRMTACQGLARVSTMHRRPSNGAGREFGAR